MAFPQYQKHAIFILLAALVQTTVLPQLWFLRIKPDLLLILAMLIAMNAKSLAGGIIPALCAGLLKDFFGLHFFGFNGLLMALSASCVYGIFHFLNKESKGIKFFIIIFASLMNYIALTIISRKPYIFLCFPEAAINCLFLPFLESVYNFFTTPLSREGRAIGYAHK